MNVNAVPECDFLLMLCNLDACRKFVELSKEVLVIGVGHSAKSVDFFEEKSVTSFARHAFNHIEMNVRKSVFTKGIVQLDLRKQLRRIELAFEVEILVTVNDFVLRNSPK